MFDYRVQRGGSRNFCIAQKLSARARFRSLPHVQGAATGFRCAQQAFFTFGRMNRGGKWSRDAADMCAGNRDSYTGSSQYNGLAFRCLRGRAANE